LTLSPIYCSTHIRKLTSIRIPQEESRNVFNAPDMKPGRAKEHVAERWSTWLGEILGLAAAQRGLSDISPILLNEIA
jgi:hypothetical protein